MRRHAAAALVFIALSVAMTWPLARVLDRAVTDPGDPFITTWVLDWDWYATFHAPLSLFHANAFHPAKYSLAFSENLYGLALLLFPLRVFGVDALTAHNIALIAGFAFSGFGAYLLGMRLTRSRIAGMTAGVFYAFVPFRFTHLPHIQHVWGGWLPLMLVALLAYAERPTRKRAIVFAALFVMNGMTNIHYLFFGALAMAITAALLIPRSAWRELLMAMAGALLVLAPFLYPYAAAAKLYGMQRTWAEVAHFSAFASDWLPGAIDEPERRLYPGALAYVMALLGLWIARRQKPQLALALALLWIAIGFAGSLGLHFVFHEFLFGGVPGFRAVRVPARWAVIAYIGMAMLIALATAVIARRNRWLALIVPAAFIVTLWAGPIRWYLIDPRTPEVYRWLATERVSAIAELPIDSGTSEYNYLLRSTAHHQKMINGVSGFAPPGRVELAALSSATPIDDEFLDALKQAGVDVIILHADLLGDRAPVVHEWLRREIDRGRLTFVRRFHTRIAGDWVFRVADGKRAESPPIQFDLCGSGTMGALDFPPPNLRFDRGQSLFSGWAISPHGIKSVDLWFDNRGERHRAKLSPDPLVTRCRATGNIARMRYLLELAKRPESISRITDVQVEVTDGRGETTVFDDRWFTWD
ncbi:MAG TPA: hypothetical protein VGQ76_28510 [Thermoanaerobaculia bacterium]|jgi:hypothetical protein|nr:hypothetical protein [Thermoanaerobaculia bacterium]